MKLKLIGLLDGDRKNIFEQAAINEAIPSQAVEKDWWVSTVLRIIYTSAHKDLLIFKGGTSLSKGWGLIERFSEDIDLAIDKTQWGYDDSIGSGRITKLRQQSRAFVRNELVPEIKSQLETSGIPSADMDFKVTDKPNQHGEDISDADPTEVIIRYRSLLEPHAYLDAQVKIEVSARSMKEPVQECGINSIVDIVYADRDFAEEAFSVTCVQPVRTFLEKAILLHEGFAMGIIGERAEKKSRHLYDLAQLMDTIHGQQAVGDHVLFASIIQHRKKYTKEKGVDYDVLSMQTLNFIPPADAIDFWREDYKKMTESMLRGEQITFDELMEKLETLQERFRKSVKADK